MELSQRIAAAVQQHHACAVALSDDLYEHPELSNQEYRSSQKIVEILHQAGYKVEYPYLGIPTAFRAVLDNGDGPSVAILTEYDALPGLGHACGHNVHGSVSVLAALAMMELKDQFRGKVYVFGTPAEETDGAKVAMAKEGVFDDISLAMMFHSWSGGRCVANMDLLSLKCYQVEFHGQEAHAVAGPWQGHNALTAARKFLDLIDARRECFTPDIHVNGVITDGGLSPNILPKHAAVRLEFRTDSMGKLNALDEIVRKCAQGAALALDCTVSFTEAFDSFADMVRVPALERAILSELDELGLPHTAVERPVGSSDMGNVSYRCPAAQPLLSICSPFHALHTPEFRDETIKAPAHAAIANGAQVITRLALRTLNDSAFRQELWESFQTAKAKKL